MGEANTNASQNGGTVDSNELILSSPSANALANVPSETELATVRQMMETLFARVEALQQNQVIQLAGVHDRLDAVELELPLIQEQGALRIRDMETRISVEIDEAARSAVEEATAAAAAAVQEEVAGKFSNLAAQMEAQRNELRLMRESKVLADTRLNRAIVDIERLCGNLAPRPEEGPPPPKVEVLVSPFRSRISEHIRQAAIDLAPGKDNPLTGDIYLKKAREERPAGYQPPTADAMIPGVAEVLRPKVADAPLDERKPVVKPEAPRSPVVGARVLSTPVAKPAQRENAVPGFEAWKRQFMQDGEPLSPTLTTQSTKSNGFFVCPRCFSDRTRPATLSRLDRLFRLADFTPHRCRSCSHRFYKRGAPPTELDDEQSATDTREAMESR